MQNNERLAGTNAQQSNEADVTMSSSHNAKPHVGSSLPVSSNKLSVIVKYKKIRLFVMKSVSIIDKGEYLFTCQFDARHLFIENQIIGKYFCQFPMSYYKQIKKLINLSFDEDSECVVQLNELVFCHQNVPL
jgi:hypothetical protein